MVQLNMNTYASTKNKSAICMDCRLEHRDVEGATYIKIIILIINVTIIITITVYTRVAHEYQYTPSLQPLLYKNFVPASILLTPCYGMASCKNNSPGHEQSAK